MNVDLTFWINILYWQLMICGCLFVLCSPKALPRTQMFRTFWEPLDPRVFFLNHVEDLSRREGRSFKKIEHGQWCRRKEFPSKICQNHLGESFSTYLFLELMLGLEPFILVLFGNGLKSQGVAIFGYPRSLVFARVHQELEKLKIYRFTSPCCTKMKTGTPLSMEIATFFQSCL